MGERQKACILFFGIQAFLCLECCCVSQFIECSQKVVSFFFFFCGIIGNASVYYEKLYVRIMTDL